MKVVKNVFAVIGVLATLGVAFIAFLVAISPTVTDEDFEDMAMDCCGFE